MAILTYEDLVRAKPEQAEFITTHVTMGGYLHVPTILGPCDLDVKVDGHIMTYTLTKSEEPYKRYVKVGPKLVKTLFTNWPLQSYTFKFFKQEDGSYVGTTDDRHTDDAIREAVSRARPRN